MRYLIDTNVLSETFKRAPDRKVVRWLTERPPLDLYLSVLEPDLKKRRFAGWLNDIKSACRRSRSV